MKSYGSTKSYEVHPISAYPHEIPIAMAPVTMAAKRPGASAPQQPCPRDATAAAGAAPGGSWCRVGSTPSPMADGLIVG